MYFRIILAMCMIVYMGHFSKFKLGSVPKNLKLFQNFTICLYSYVK